MSKEDIMNKISFALKDPILQMGFEVICSKLSRLEKENAELDCQMNRNKYCYSCVNATGRCFRNEIGCPCEKYKSYKDLNKQLTKAKEIIKKFSEFVNNEVEFDSEHPQEHTDLWNELCEKAEQFLSEVENQLNHQ